MNTGRSVSNQSARVREIRRRLGLSQEALARLLGVSMQSVWRWEAGHARPLPIVAARLAELQRVTGRGSVEEGGEAMAGDKGRPDERGGGVEVDVRFGLGGLLKGVGDIVAMVSRLADEGSQGAARSFRVETRRGKGRDVHGVTVTAGMGVGRPPRQDREDSGGPAASADAEAREPLVDVMAEDDAIVVIAELPGVEEGDIEVGATPRTVRIAASTRRKRYAAEVTLPAAVRPASLERSYRNGLLEIRLARAEADHGETARG